MKHHNVTSYSVMSFRATSFALRNNNNRRGGFEENTAIWLADTERKWQFMFE